MSAEKYVLIVLKIKSDPVLCSLKIILDHSENKNASSQSTETRLQATNSMHKFFKNIIRNNFGPLSYLTSTIYCNDHRRTYLSEIKSLSFSKDFRKDSYSMVNCFCGKKMTNGKN